MQLVPAGGELVLQIDADNSGAWPLHCHITGMLPRFLADIKNLPILAITA